MSFKFDFSVTKTGAFYLLKPFWHLIVAFKKGQGAIAFLLFLLKAVLLSIMCKWIILDNQKVKDM